VRPRRAASAAKEQEEANTVLQVLRQAMLENGWAPSQRDLAEVTGFTAARVNYLMQLLKPQGLVELGPNPREVRIVGSSMVIPPVSL
jgi:DNA-binding IclR family transcriptional regulator